MYMLLAKVVLVNRAIASQQQSLAYEPKRDFDAALQEAFGVDYATFEQEWQDWVIERYGS